MPPTPKPRASAKPPVDRDEINPFEDVKAAFVADLPTKRWRVRMFGAEGYVEVGAMDEAAWDDYDRAMTAAVASLDPAALKALADAAGPEQDVPRAALSALSKIDFKAAHQALLVGAVRSFLIPTQKTTREGDTVAELRTSEGLSDEERFALLSGEGLTREFRRALLEACARINHTDPFLLAHGLFG